MKWSHEDRGKLFRAYLDTALKWDEISSVLKEWFRNEGYSVIKEEKDVLELGKGQKNKPKSYFPEIFESYYYFTLKKNTLEATFKYKDKIKINKRYISYLIVNMEDLEQILNNQEDAMVVKEGKVAENGTSLVNDKGKYLVKGVLNVNTKADPVYGKRILFVVLLPVLGLLVLLVHFIIKSNTWIALGIAMLPMLFLFIIIGIWQLKLPTSVILKPDNLILQFRKRDEELTYDSIDSIDGPVNLYDFFLKYNHNGTKKQTVINQEPAYRISQAMDNRKIATNLEKWMLPSWRKSRDGLSAAIPNRIRSRDEPRARGYRAYILNDSLRTLILVKTEYDRKILLESVKNYWSDANYLEDILHHAVFEEYDEEVIKIGKRLLELNPEKEEIQKYTFGSLLKLKKIEESYDMINNMIKGREPSSCEELILSSILKEKGLIDKALYHIGRAVEKDPNNLDALRTWIQIVSSESGKAQSLSELDYLSNQYPQAWGPPCALGEWLFMEGDSKQAELYLESAIKREPSEEVVGIMSSLYGKDGRLDELVSFVENARKKGNVGTAALINLTNAYINLGSWKKARSSLDLAAKVAPFEYLPIIYDIREFLNEQNIR